MKVKTSIVPGYQSRKLSPICRLPRVSSFVFALLSSQSLKAQTTYDWLDTAPDGNWKQGAGGARWSGGLWDEPAPTNVLRFNINHQLSMTNNVNGTYSVHGLIFGSNNSSSRSLGGNPVRFFDFSSADPYIRNESNTTHAINFNLEGDGTVGDPLNIQLNGSGGLTFSGSLNNQGSFINVEGSGTGGTATFNGVISGSGGLYKGGNEVTAVLAAQNTYQGATTLASGTILATHSNAFGDSSGGVSVTSGARLQLQGGISVGNESLSLGGTGISSSGSLQNISGDNTWAGNILLTSTSRITSNSGELTLSGSIDFGNTSLLSLEMAGNGDIDLGGNLTKVLNGSQNLSKAGEGTLTLSGNNHGKLMFNLSGGTLAVSAPQNLGNLTGVASYPDKVNFLANSSLHVTESMTLGSVGTDNNFGFRIANSTTATFQISGNKTLTIDGLIAGISGTGNLTKAGDGKMVLTQANSYTGQTTVSAGTLVVNGSLAGGNVAVEEGAKLAGNGTIGGATTVNGKLAPTPEMSGDSLSFSNALTFGGSSSIFEWTLEAGPLDPGSGSTNQGSYGQVAVAGSVSGTSVFEVVLGQNGYADAFWNTAKSWSNVFNASGANLDPFFTAISGNGIVYDSESGRGVVGGEGYFAFSGSSLTWTAVPEPNSALAGLLVAAGLIRRRR